MKKVTETITKARDDKLPTGWSIKLWTEEINGEHSIEFCFPVSSGGENRVSVSYELVDSPAQIRAKLRQLGASIPLGKEKANRFVEALLVHIPKNANRKVAMPGWNGKDFVMANRVFGKGKGQLKLSDAARAKSAVAGRKGSFKAWQKDVADVSNSSTYIAFAMMIGFAAPLLRFAGLTEGAVFNYSQVSSVGKTTASKCAASIFGNPLSLCNWNSTAISLEELAAVHNDMLLVLDDTETSTKGKLTELLDKVAHVLTAGRAKSYSRFYAGADMARKLRWNCLALSSSPDPIDKLYSDKGQSRTEGQRIRLIDIPLPNIDAGVFDLITGTNREIELGVTSVLKRIERDLKRQYGTAIPIWVKHIQNNDPTDKIATLITKFVEGAVPTGSGPEKRLASKFGLIYAAGIMASSAGLVPWKKQFVRQVVTTCYDLARAGLETAAKNADAGLKKFEQVVSDKARFPFLSTASIISKEASEEMLGFRTKKGDQLLLAVLGKRLTRITGNPGITTQLLNDLKHKGILLEGHGGTQTRQFQIHVKSRIKGKKPKTFSRKPRFYVFDLPALRKHFVKVGDNTLH